MFPCVPLRVDGGLVLLVALGAATCSCGGDDDDGSASATIDGASPAASPADGGASTPAVDGAEVPADFPRDEVALPDGAALRSASGAAPGPWILIYALDGDVEQTVTAYRDVLTADGFILEDEASAGTLVTSFVVNGNGFRVNVLGSGEPAGAIVTVEQAA